MTAHRPRLGAALLAFVPATMVAGGGCGGATEMVPTEPTSEERAVTVAALLDQLSVEGALLDDSPSVRLLASTTSTASLATRIAMPRTAVPRPLDKLLRGWGVDVPASCVTVLGALPDADQDGIPATASAHLRCSSATYDVTGTAFLIDDDDRDPASGFALGLQDLRVQTETLGGALTRTADASFLVTLHPDPSPGAVDMKVDVHVATVRPASNGAVTVSSSASSGTTTYLPDADLTPTTRSQHGSVTSTVHTTVTYAGVARTWTRRAPLSLHWSLACKSGGGALAGFDGGSVVYTDDRGSTLRIDFSSCGTWSVSP